MDKHREYVQERMNGMYNIIEEFNNPILEAVKKDNHKKMCQVSFLNYLEYKYDDKNVKYEIKAAETDAEKLKIVKKYAKDYESWKKRTTGLSLSWIGALIAQLSIGAAPITLCAVSILLYGNVIRILINDEKERNEIGTAKYKKENKK